MARSPQQRPSRVLSALRERLAPPRSSRHGSAIPRPPGLGPPRNASWTLGVVTKKEPPLNDSEEFVQRGSARSVTPLASLYAVTDEPIELERGGALSTSTLARAATSRRRQSVDAPSVPIIGAPAQTCAESAQREQTATNRGISAAPVAKPLRDAQGHCITFPCVRPTERSLPIHLDRGSFPWVPMGRILRGSSVSGLPR